MSLLRKFASITSCLAVVLSIALVLAWSSPVSAETPASGRFSLTGVVGTGTFNPVTYELTGGTVAGSSVNTAGKYVSASRSSFSTYTPLGDQVEVATATGTGIAGFDASSGTISDLTAVPESSLPLEGKPNLIFPHGFFEFVIKGITAGQSVTITITLPSAVPVGTQYWKYGRTPDNGNPHWYQITMGDNDGDNVITITLTDGGLGDDDLLADSAIVDQGGPGQPPAPSGGATGAPVFPSIYIGIAAALGAGILAYFVRRRWARQ